MRLRAEFLGLTFLVGLFAIVMTGKNGVSAAGDPHAYFNELIGRRDVFKAYSLRPVAGQPISSPYYGQQLARPSQLGYLSGNSAPITVTYSPSTDTDAHAQDAAKMWIPAFTLDGTNGIGTVSEAISAGSNPIKIVAGYGPSYNIAGRAVMLDREIMEIYDPDGSAGPLRPFDRDTGVLYVRRGQYSTSSASHAAGAVARLSINTIPNGLKVPLGTSDGHTYFFTWDAYWTDSYLGSGLTNHKAFNIMSNTIWFEPQANYGGGTGSGRVAGFNPATDVAAFQVRGYNKPGGGSPWTPEFAAYAGPGVTTVEPISQRTTFVIKPNTWVRLFVRLEQRANDYDYVDMWIADERTDPVQVLARVPLSVTTNVIEKFAFEYNTSTDKFTRGDLRNLVAYARNFVALSDPSDIAGLLRRPEGVASVAGPAAPRNVRVVRE